MKTFLLVISLLIVCCHAKETNWKITATPAAADTTNTISTGVYLVTADTCNYDSLKMVIDSLSNKLFVASYKLERVKYYLNITLRNPSQTQFLKGWIKRAIQ